MELPQEFIRRMHPLLGDDWAAFCDAYGQPLRRGVRVNTQKLSNDRFRALFGQALTPAPFAADSFYADAPFKAGSDPLHHAGAYYVQEPSASSAVTVLAPRPGERVLDLCAAPGGKSTQIAAALGDTGLLWSNEYVPSRVRALEQNLERFGARRAVVSCCDSATLCHALAGFFDAVAVDAPCSGEGMFRKEPQALDIWSTDNIRLCAARQAEILANAAIAVRPGGRLVYSTCTFAPEENEAVVADFLLTHPEFTLLPIEVPWGDAGFDADTLRDYLPNGANADLTRCRRIFPHRGGEGHFIALLGKCVDAPADAPAPYVPPARDPHRDEATALYADCFSDTPDGVFVTVGDTVRLLPEGLPSLTGCGVRTAGPAVAAVCKNRLEPCHAAFLAARCDNCRRICSFPADDPRLTAFLRGEELAAPEQGGWTAVAVEGIPLGFGKAGGGRLKNRYPKGLRLL